MPMIRIHGMALYSIATMIILLLGGGVAMMKCVTIRALARMTSVLLPPSIEGLRDVDGRHVRGTPFQQGLVEYGHMRKTGELCLDVSKHIMRASDSLFVVAYPTVNLG